MGAPTKGINMNKPIIAITMGDPAGIGPEIVVKTLNHQSIYEICNPLVLGSKDILKYYLKQLDINLELVVVNSPAAGKYQFGKLNLIDLNIAKSQQIKPGELSATAGEASMQYIFKAIELAMKNEVAAVVTAPINKEAIALAGYKYPGHTEIFADKTNSQKVSMLLTAKGLNVIHVSMHVSLEEAIRRVKKQRILDVIELAQQSCMLLGINNPRIAVAGLNPHASEGGLFGDQEEKEIIPAIEEARSRNFNVFGPIPGDTVFLKATKNFYDIVIAMYHDQGHIPMKLLSFDTGVNVSVGLPIIRTSVDHGTAFDIAGKRIASEISLIEAIKVAVKMVEVKKANV